MNYSRMINPVFFATLCGALPSACSGYYPLGDRSDALLPLDGDGSTARADVGDGRVAAGLLPPDVTIGTDTEVGPGTLASVGDLDGDGRDEMAIAGLDWPNPVSFVQLRYGGPRPSDTEQVFAFAHGGSFLTLPNDDYITPSISAAGDVDGDGYGDLLVRTGDCDVTGPVEGSYLVYGGPERIEGSVPLASVAARFVPRAREAHPRAGFGLSCAGAPQLAPAGDLDGDGFDDLVISREPITDTSTGDAIFGTGEGVYVFYGRSRRFSGEVPLESADATFHVAERVQVYSYTDIDGDGRADLIVSPDAYQRPAPGSYLLRSHAERFSGALDLADSATLLAGAYVTSMPWQTVPGDLDGDGLTEVLLFDSQLQRHLFYGAPGLFAEGVDFNQADASVGTSAGYVFSIGDRDGDGDDELLDQFSNPNATGIVSSTFSDNVAFASGSRARLSGVIPFPEAEVTKAAPDGLFPDERSRDGNTGRTLRYAVPAGDLDGDGAADLFTTSVVYETEDVQPSSFGYQVSSPQVHIHYGVLAQPATVVR